MPDTNQPDWFSQNAAPIAPGGSDWFSSNAPKQDEPSTWQKLTSGYDPGAAEFAEKHPVLGAPVRALSAAGGAVLATPGAIASSVAHPIDTAKALGNQVSEAYKYYAPSWAGGNPNQHPSWEAIKSVAPEALGQATGTVAAGEATGLAQRAALRPVIDTLKDVPLAGWKPLAERAAPRMEAAGNEVRATVTNSLKAAEARVAPLYENMETADKADLARTGKPGSVDISKASQALEDARKKMYGEEPGPRVVQKEGAHLEQYAPNSTTSLADLKTARALRSQLSDEIGSAIAKGDRQTASALSAAKTEVTNAMGDRAKELGLEKDFNTADPQWREIQQHRERLGPLTQQENSAKLFETYRKASPELQNSIDALDKAGLLDKERLDELGKATGRVQSAQEGGNFLPWIKRAAYGVVPYEIAEKTGLIPKLGISPYILGGAGATLGIAGIRRLLAERALTQLPELESRGPGLRAVTPSTPTFPTIPPEAAPRPVGPTPGGIPPVSGEAMLRMRVPLNEQTQPGERPFENMLEQVRQETQENPQGAQNEQTLKNQLATQSQKALTKARTQEAVAPFKQTVPLGRELFTGQKTAAPAAEMPSVPSARTKLKPLAETSAPSANDLQATAAIDKLRNQRNRTNDPAKYAALDKKYKAAVQEFYKGKGEASEQETQAPAPKQSRTATFDSLPPEHQEWISNWAKEVNHLPQSLRQAEMDELKKFGGQGTLLKERIAMQHVERQKNPAREAGDEGPNPIGYTPGGASAEAMRQERGNYEERRNRQLRRTRPEREY